MTLTLKWIQAFYDMGKALIRGAKDEVKTGFVDDMKLEVALSSIHEEEYESEEVQGIVKRIKEDWGNSPESPSQFVESLMSVFKGQLASLQLTNMVDVDLDLNAPVSKAMFKQLGVITDLSLLASTLSVIGEVLSVGQIDKLGDEMRAYLDYSGLSQITGFGYGMILSNAVSPLMTQEINEQVRPGLLDVDRALNMKYREIIDQGTYIINLRKQGYTEKQIDELDQAYKYYPAATDFIRFAVRDVFNPEVVSKWGYDSDFPSEIEPFINKAGMDLEILRWYWRAHWELPSPRMGYEMMHRGQLDQEELRELLRISDYAPGYIEKMIAISYSPYTRVDAKRMFQKGILSESDLVTAYTDIGYNTEMANNLLSWVKADSMGSEKDLTRAQILKGYDLGLITREVTLDYIQGLGYDTDEAELIVSIDDSNRENKVLENRLKTLRVRYARDVIGDSNFKIVCNRLGLDDTHIEMQLIRAQDEKSRKIKLPTKADLESWVANGLIEELIYRRKMKSLGYQDEDIDYYVREVFP